MTITFDEILGVAMHAAKGDVKVSTHACVDAPDLKISLEVMSKDGHALPYVGVHCEMYKWSHIVAKGVASVWADCLEELDKRGIKGVFTLIEHDNTKLRKFAEMYGFEYLGSLTQREGEVVNVYGASTSSKEQK